MSGPFAAMRLGDLGADVIKVEPVTGEWQRHVSAGGARGHRVNVSFLSLNRNKRSLAVNLKDAGGKRLVHELAKNADVFLQNYRPGVAARLGMDYGTVRDINPHIVYVSVSGYGEAGPYASWPGQDLILQGMSGAMFSAGRRAGPPQPSPMYVVDAVTAYVAFEAALAGLLHRERTGEGQLVEVNMLDAIVTLQMQEMSVFTVGGLAQQRTSQPHAHCFIRAPYSAFATAEGYLILAFPPLPRLGEVLAIPELTQMDDEADGHARRDEIHRLVARRLLDRPASEWLALFAEHDIWAGPVYSYQDVVNDPQVRHNGALVTYRHPTEGEVTTPGFAIRFTRSPSSVRRGAPLTGEHTREILAELGLTGRQVDDLLAAGVVAAEQQ
jgi:crotonobetainyl-CoA:carnitine CoA-transferase CaiB-like acyl-CoA transferase